MKISEIKEILEAEVFYGAEYMDRDIASVCGCDLMSDVLAFTKKHDMLLTGLVNPQTVRTAEMMDMKCVVFVCSKKPDECMVNLARECDIVLMGTSKRLYSACGILYQSGLVEKE